MTGFFRLLVYGILFYLLYKLFSSFFQPRQKRTNVKGKPKSKPLDLSKKDVQDVKFKEENEKNDQS